MGKITAQDVNKLRQATGAGMMDCKKALQESEGDFDKAIEYLRKKGQKLASKRADKSANEGIVIAKSSDDNTFGAMMMLNCETDFVAKNQEFVDFANGLIDFAVANKIADITAFKAAAMDNGRTVEENITEMVGKTGEKLELNKFDSLTNALVLGYNHHGNRLGSLISFDKAGGEIAVMGHDVAMQVAAMSPAGVDQSDVPQDVIDRELEIGREQARQEGKPEQIIEKIAAGKLNKFMKENTLMNQEFIKEAKTSVKDYMARIDKDVKVVCFKRFMLGE